MCVIIYNIDDLPVLQRLFLFDSAISLHRRGLILNLLNDIEFDILLLYYIPELMLYLNVGTVNSK